MASPESNSPPRRLLASLERGASMEAWDELIGFIQEQVERALPGSPKGYGMVLAAEELLSNMIRVASEAPAEGSGPCRIRCRTLLEEETQPRRFVLEISDDGMAFDPHFEAIPDALPSIPVEQRRIGGLGLFLVKSSVDDARYSYLEGRNTYLLSAILD